MDIIYIPMARGFVYLTAVIDWFSRRVLNWRLSITMQADFCIEAVEEALARFGAPEIFNTDQGSQFTSIDFTKVLLAKGIKISMDGRAPGATTSSSSGSGNRWKYEEVYLRAYETVSQARTSIGRYLDFYNGRRSHSSLGRKTPDHAYFNQPLLAAAKPGRQSTHQADETVQTNRATSFLAMDRLPVDREEDWLLARHVIGLSRMIGIRYPSVLITNFKYNLIEQSCRQMILSNRKNIFKFPGEPSLKR